MWGNTEARKKKENANKVKKVFFYWLVLLAQMYLCYFIFVFLFLFSFLLLLWKKKEQSAKGF